MKSSIRFGRVAPWLGLSLLAGYLAPALGQTEAASTITKLTPVDVQQTGKPPTGPFAVVVEHDPGLATHTIYRPRELTMDDHPVLVWGEGGCAKNGLMFPEYLSEIASHGFVVIADGPPIARPAGGPAAGGGAPPPGAGRRSAGGPLHHGEWHGACGSHRLARGGEQEPQQPLLRKSERRAHRGDGHVVRRA